ncbi:MAG: GDP-mannose 4,6-dehydratase [Thermoplasmata archaeon]
MKILITGASGFIGRYLSFFAADHGHEVVGTYLSETDLSSRTPKHSGIRWVGLDMRKVAEVRALVKETQADAVFHLAAQAYAQKAWKDPLDTFDTNVSGTIRLYEALRETPPPRGVLLTASASAYGAPPSLPVSEDAPFRPTNPYGVSKACQELLSTQYASNFGLRIVRARLFGTTGPGKTGDALNDFARQIAALERAGNPAELRVGSLDKRRDISDIRDSVHALWTVFEKGTPEQAINVGAGQSFSIQEIVDELVRLARVPIAVVRDPALVRPTDEPDNRADIRRLKSLGYSPRLRMEETIRDSLNYWREEVTSGPGLTGPAR